MSIGGLAMNRIVLAGIIAVAALTTVTGAARADNVCVWTGFDWACGDGHVFTQHFSAAQGPNMIITPRQTEVNPAQVPSPYYPPRSY